MAINHKHDWFGGYDDWMYDEIRYSLENRDYNKTNGLVAVYTPEVEEEIIARNANGTISVKEVDNLFRKNMMNVKPQYKKNPSSNIYDRDYDSYCSLISWNDFTSNLGKYIDISCKKREELYKYNIVKRL